MTLPLSLGSQLILCGLAIAVLLVGEVKSQEATHSAGNFVTVNGARIWYESEGSGEPILLIPIGPGSTHDYFHPQFSSLAEKHRVIYFDPFGRGKSDRAKSPREYTFERDVDDVEGLRKALGLERLTVLGHSYGGMVAIAYALKYRTSVHKLILSNTQISSEAWQGFNDSWNAMIRNHYPDVWQRLQSLRAQGFHSSAPEIQKVYDDLPGGLILSYFDASNRKKLSRGTFNPEVWYALGGDDLDYFVKGDLAKLDFRTQLIEIKLPTLVLAGRFDRGLLPKFAIQFKQFAPQAEFVMFEKSGHFPWVEETANFFDTIKAFVDKR